MSNVLVLQSNCSKALCLHICAGCARCAGVCAGLCAWFTSLNILNKQRLNAPCAGFLWEIEKTLVRVCARVHVRNDIDKTLHTLHNIYN